MKILVKALNDDVEFNLQVELLAGLEGLTRTIEHSRIQKPGLAIAGLSHTLHPGRLQVLGRSEMQYLYALNDEVRRVALEPLFRSGVSGLVITTGLKPVQTLLDLATEESLAVFSTPLTSGTFINRVHEFLDEYLSPEMTLHGVLVDVFGVGVLLIGHSGIGKSECALELVLRGHRLVADDVVVLRKRERDIFGFGSPLTKHHMEVRGLGIINVQDLFGAASVCERLLVGLIVEMFEWEAGSNYDRLGVDDNFMSLLDIDIPKVRLPVRPGRNMAAIVEVAARNHLLKSQGHHSARRFQETLERRLSATAEQLGSASPTEVVSESETELDDG